MSRPRLAIAIAFLLSLFVSLATAHAADVRLRLLDPDGKPAASAKAAIVPAGRTVFVTNGATFDDDPNYVLGQADAEGHLALHTDAPDFLVIALHDRGYLNLDRDAALAASEGKLTPWGRIEGRVLVGPNPAAHEPVTAIARRPGEGMPGAKIPGWLFVSTGKTDADGRFVIGRVAAERTSVWCARKYWNDFTTYSRPEVKVDVPAGGTARVTLGGKGRPVVGRVEVPESLKSEPDWQFVYCVMALDVPRLPPPVPADVRAKPLREQADWWQAFRGTPAERAWRDEQNAGYDRQAAHTHPFEVAPDGTFRVDDVSPGEYDLTVAAMIPWREGRPGKHLGEAKVRVTVEPFQGERTDEPQAVPPIAWKTATGPLVKAGDVAPDFSVPAFDGSTLRLSDYRGKFVLIDFWATWCGPCVEEMPNLIAAYRQFAPTGKVEFISLSLDGEPDAPLAFVEREKINWKQGFLGAWSEDSVTKAYDVGGIPSVFLIDPDGKVIARGLRGEDVATAIGKALAGDGGNAASTAPAGVLDR